MIKSHSLSDLNNRDVFSHPSVDCESEIKVSAGLGPSGNLEGESVPCPSLSFWWGLAVLGSRGSRATPAVSVSVITLCALLCVCLLMVFPSLGVCAHISHLLKGTRHWNRPILIQYDLTLT